MREKTNPAISSAPRDPYLWILERVRSFLKPLEFWLVELRSPVRLPVRRTVHAWRRGFGRAGSLAYRLDENPCSLYVSQYQQNVPSAAINGHFDHIVNNKLVFPLLMRSVGLQSPRIFATRRAGDWFQDDGSILARPAAWLADLLKRHETLVFKPVKGLKGKGLVFLRGGGKLTMNGVEASDSDLENLLGGSADAIVTEFVRQADYAAQLYPFTSNSVRVLTLWDYEQGRPFIAAAAQRIGCERSRPVDNWRAGAGGLSAEVDLETGVLSAGATIRNQKIAWFAAHPETGAQIEGVHVSHWNQVRSLISEAAAKLFFTRILGWDVLMTESGFTVLEVNGPPGLALHQVHRPLLADPRVRRFYEKHGVISPEKRRD